jgi:hypothetical protein
MRGVEESLFDVTPAAVPICVAPSKGAVRRGGCPANMLGLTTDRYFHPNGQRPGRHSRLRYRVFIESDFEENKPFTGNRQDAPWRIRFRVNGGLRICLPLSRRVLW